MTINVIINLINADGVVVQAYSDIASKSHENLTIIPAGLYVDIERSYIGVSPDRIITCSCCGRGCLSDNLCMTKSGDKWTLKKNHSYFHQVQTQLHVFRLL